MQLYNNLEGLQLTRMNKQLSDSHAETLHL
jgi:hypothetical protein